MQCGGLFLQEVTTGLNTFAGHNSNCHDISMIRNILETSFVDFDLVTGCRTEGDVF